MAEGKKSFIVYTDSKSLVDLLTNETAGELFKMLFSYTNDENPQTDDPLLAVAFEHFKQLLKRDLTKWNGIKEKRSKAGKASAESRKQKATNSTHVKSVEKNLTNLTVNVNDNVSVNVNDINSRMAVFKKNLLPFLDKYPDDMFEGFYHYWTEHNENGKKMRFEYAKNQPFNIKRRLATWFKRQNDFEKEKSSGKKENAGEMLIKQIQNG